MEFVAGLFELLLNLFELFLLSKEDKNANS
jgi:hypothetical protein